MITMHHGMNDPLAIVVLCVGALVLLIGAGLLLGAALGARSVEPDDEADDAFTDHLRWWGMR